MKLNHLPCLCHVMHPKHVCSSIDRPSMQNGGAVQRLVAWDIEHALDHGFTTDTHQDGALQREKFRQGIEEGVIVIQGLSKPNQRPQSRL